MTRDEAKRIPLADLMAKLGFQPAQVRRGGLDLWYLSPFRTEMEPSFHVDVRKNVWFDFGAGEGGDGLNLLKRLRGLTFQEAILFLENRIGSSVSSPVFEKKEPFLTVEKGLILEKTGPLTHPALLEYLTERGISHATARRYLSEAVFFNNDKRYFALAFPNRSGGWEVRNRWFKGSLGGKDFSFLPAEKTGTSVSVFEGFMDFLSCLMLNQTERLSTDVVILHSTAFRQRAAEFLQNAAYSAVFTYLDNDRAGEEARLFFERNLPAAMVVPMNDLYGKGKDLNEGWATSGTLRPDDTISKTKP